MDPSGPDAEFVVPAGETPVPLDRLLRERHAGASWGAVRRLVRSGKVFVDGVTVLDPSARVTAGSTIRLRHAAPRPSRGPRIGADAIVHVDAQVVVVRKPAGLSTAPHGDERDTLDRIVREALERRSGRRGPPVSVVHRLDKETSGLLVFARSKLASQHLRAQFRARRVHRRYRALVHGVVEDATFRSRLVANRGDGFRGSTSSEHLGREAITHVRRIELLRAATLVECRLETGRTHQIRIHLSEAGHPLLGERVYGRRYPGALLPAPRVMLHAGELGFEHPSTGKPLRFEEPLPADFVEVLESLRRRDR